MKGEGGQRDQAIQSGLVDDGGEGRGKMNGLMDRSLSTANKDRWVEMWRVKRNASAESGVPFEAVHN